MCFYSQLQAKVCLPDVSKQLPCSWRKHGESACAVKKIWQLSISFCMQLVMAMLSMYVGPSGNTWPCCTLRSCCLLWGERVGKSSSVGELEVAPVAVWAKGMRQDEGGEGNCTVPDCKWVEYRAPFILVWDFLPCFVLLFVLFSHTSSEALNRVLTCGAAELHNCCLTIRM